MPARNNHRHQLTRWTSHCSRCKANLPLQPDHRMTRWAATKPQDCSASARLRRQNRACVVASQRETPMDAAIAETAIKVYLKEIHPASMRQPASPKRPTPAPRPATPTGRACRARHRAARLRGDPTARCREPDQPPRQGGLAHYSSPASAAFSHPPARLASAGLPSCSDPAAQQRGKSHVPSEAKGEASRAKSWRKKSGSSSARRNEVREPIPSRPASSRCCRHRKAPPLRRS